MPLLGYQLSLRYAPVILERLLDEIPVDRYADLGSDDRFSLLEIICHLADFESIFYDRMATAVEQDSPEFGSIDVSARAIERGYSDRNIREELEVFASRRTNTIAFLEGLSDESLARWFVLSIGPITVKEYVAVISGHDVYHVEQVTGYLKKA